MFRKITFLSLDQSFLSVLQRTANYCGGILSQIRGMIVKGNGLPCFHSVVIQISAGWNGIYSCVLVFLFLKGESTYDICLDPESN